MVIAIPSFAIGRGVALAAHFVCGGGVISLLAQGDPPHPRRWRAPMKKLGSGRRIVLKTADSVSRFSSQTITQTPTVEGNDSPSADPLERHGLILPAESVSSPSNRSPSRSTY